MSYLDLDEEEEYDLICKFEDYYAKHIENQDACTSKKKKDKEKQVIEKQVIEKQIIKPKRSFVRSKFINQKNNESKDETMPTLYYY